MHLTVTAQQRILNNPAATPAQKERALLALREIPAEDPRYGDARSVLSALGPIVDNAAQPIESDYRLQHILKLYLASQSDDESVRQAATTEIEKNIDQWLSEVLSVSDEKGKPKFAGFGDLAIRVTGWIDYPKGPLTPEFREHINELKTDKCGILVRHLLLEKARALKTGDRDYLRLFGDKFLLSIFWGDPCEPREVILPDFEGLAL